MEVSEIRRVGRDLYGATISKRVIEAPVIQYPEMSYADAYMIQTEMVHEYLRAGYHLAGKKIGLTSMAMRKLAGIDEPDYGVIFHELGFLNGERVSRELFLKPSIEAELAFHLKQDLTGDHITAEDVLEATDHITGALEVVDMRQDFCGKSVLNSIADNACFGGYVLGDIPIDPKTVDLGLLGMVLYKNNEPIDSACGSAVMDHPAIAGAWLANKMVELKTPLREGEVILTGSFIQAIPMERGDTVRALFGHVGEVSVTLI